MAHGSTWRVLGIVFLALVAVAFGGVVFAQEAGQQPPAEQQEQPPPEEQAEPTGEFVGEVVVTAQKRPEDIQEVPVAVSTLSGTDLSVILTAGPDMRALSGRVPSLVMESSFGRAFPRFYMRGLGNSDFDLNASQPVSMVVDEVVLENPIVKGMPLFDLDRIEVLRGPQGTLFGRNTGAGLIKFETMRPTREWDANFRLSYGSYDNIDVNGGVGGPLTDTLSMRFSGLYQSESDWVDNKHTGEDNALGGYTTTAYRLQFLWEPSEKFSGLLNVHGWDVDGTARIFRANIIKKGTNDLVDDFAQDVVYHDGQNKQDISSMGGLLRLEYDFGPATLTSVTGYESLNDMYSRGDIDGGFGSEFDGIPGGPGFIPFYSETADGLPSLDQITEELRIASNDAEVFNWLVGAYYFDEDADIETYSYNSREAGSPQEGYATQTQQTTAYALFGSIDYKIAEDWSIKAGLRYSKDEKDFAAERPWPVFSSPTVAPIEEHTSSDNVSWDLSASYRVNPDVNVYGRLATGYRGPSIQGRILFCADFEGGTNPATDCVSVADEETNTSFEVGVKSILAGQRLRLNLAAYIFQMDGQQVTAVGGQYNTATLLNVDKTDGHGFEADIEYIASANVFMTMGLSWNPTEINDENLTVSPCGLSGSVCTITDPRTPGGDVLIDGNTPPFSPEWVFSGILNFQSNPVSKGFFGSLDWAYSSDKSFFLYESEEFHSDSLEFGLRLGYGFGGGKYEVALWGRNILDEEIVQGGIDFDNLTGMMNEPRMLGLEFVAHF